MRLIPLECRFVLLAGLVISAGAARSAGPSPAPAAPLAALTETFTRPAGKSAACPPAVPPSADAAARETAAAEDETPPEIDDALRESREALATGNLRPRKVTEIERIKLEVLQSRLSQGRAQRRERDFPQAERTLASLLAQEAPMEIQRGAMLELALAAQDQRQYGRAQQIYSQFLQKFHEDPSVPEVLLRQGLLYRDMGAPVLGLTKFYAVMSAALNLKLDRLAYYQRLVLQAQTEIAETYYAEGRFEEAADFFGRLLKLDERDLNREQILYKLVRSWSAAGKAAETRTQAGLFLAQFPQSPQVYEVRFLLADALKRLDLKKEAREQVLDLLREQQTSPNADPELIAYWRQRTGNELANQFYQEGDFLRALEIYLRLAELNPASGWRCPALYQAALSYERLRQPGKADELYTRLLEEGKTAAATAPPASLANVLEMARWRQERLGWQAKAEAANQEISQSASTSREN